MCKVEDCRARPELHRVHIGMVPDTKFKYAKYTTTSCIGFKIMTAVATSERGHPLNCSQEVTRVQKRVLVTARTRMKQEKKRDDHKGHRAGFRSISVIALRFF